MTRRPRHNTHRDSNQAIITAALRAAGIHTIDVSGPFSAGDLFAWGYHVTEDRWMWILLEVKTAEGELTPGQVEFMAEHPGAVQVVRTVGEALALWGRGGM